MYFASTAESPTARDVATWVKVSETPIDTPLHKPALRTLQAEIEDDPTVAGNHYLIGMVYADLGDYHLAINALQHALELEPQLGVSSVQIAQIFQQKEIYDQAIKHYTQALRTAPSAEVFGALGTLWLLQDKFKEAVNSLQRRSPLTLLRRHSIKIFSPHTTVGASTTSKQINSRRRSNALNVD